MMPGSEGIDALRIAEKIKNEEAEENQNCAERSSSRE